jgi:hypothetical protein
MTCREMLKRNLDQLFTIDMNFSALFYFWGAYYLDDVQLNRSEEYNHNNETQRHFNLQSYTLYIQGKHSTTFSKYYQQNSVLVAS